MRNLNFLTKLVVALTLILTGLSVYKIISYRSSARFYYISSVSSPEEFPIRILGIGFWLEDGNFTSDSFYK